MPERRTVGARPAVRYLTGECVLGRVVLAATDHGMCAVGLGDSEADLLAFLRAEFPAGGIGPDAAGLGGWLAALVRHIGGHTPGVELPLNVRGSAFQKRVWEELRRIPPGETRTYKQLAGAVGAATAVRAVARACATNPVSVLIPCHRVVGSDGKLTGYRWGIDRKRMLLERERRQAGSPGSPAVTPGPPARTGQVFRTG